MSPVAPSEYYYPQPVSDVAELRTEMRRAARDHGRINVCGWICRWMPGSPMVRWDQALVLVGGTL